MPRGHFLDYLKNKIKFSQSFLNVERIVIDGTLWMESVKRKLQLISMRYDVTYAIIYGFIYPAIILLDMAIENYKRIKCLGTVRSA